MHGKLLRIALTGPRGIGKSTTAARVQEALNAAGIPCEKVGHWGLAHALRRSLGERALTTSDLAALQAQLAPHSRAAFACLGWSEGMAHAERMLSKVPGAPVKVILIDGYWFEDAASWGAAAHSAGELGPVTPEFFEQVLVKPDLTVFLSAPWDAISTRAHHGERAAQDAGTHDAAADDLDQLRRAADALEQWSVTREWRSVPLTGRESAQNLFEACHAVILDAAMESIRDDTFVPLSTLAGLPAGQNDKTITQCFGAIIAGLVERPMLPLPDSWVVRGDTTAALFERLAPLAALPREEFLRAARLGVEGTLFPTGFSHAHIPKSVLAAFDGREGAHAWRLRASHVADAHPWPLQDAFPDEHFNGVDGLTQAVASLVHAYFNRDLRDRTPVLRDAFAALPGGFLIQPVPAAAQSGTLRIAHASDPNFTPWTSWISVRASSEAPDGEGSRALHAQSASGTTLETLWAQVPVLMRLEDCLLRYGTEGEETEIAWTVLDTGRLVVESWRAAPWMDVSKYGRAQALARVPEALTPLSASWFGDLAPHASRGLVSYFPARRGAEKDPFAFDASGWLFERRDLCSHPAARASFALRMRLGRLFGHDALALLLRAPILALQADWLHFLPRYLAELHGLSAERGPRLEGEGATRADALALIRAVRPLAEQMMAFSLPARAWRIAIEAACGSACSRFLVPMILNRGPLVALAQGDGSGLGLPTGWEIRAPTLGEILDRPGATLEPEIARYGDNETELREAAVKEHGLAGLYSALLLIDDEQRQYAHATSPLLRKGLEGMARLLEIAVEDIYFLTMTEIEDLLSGVETRTEAAPLIALRKADWLSGAAVDPAQREPHLSYERKVRVEGRAPRDAAWAHGSAPQIAQEREGGVASLDAPDAVVEGPVLHVRALSDLPKIGAHASNGIKPIVVAHAPLPGLIAFFDQIAGIVTEQGSRSSHLAVACEHLGLPVLAGLEGALERYPEHALVRLTPQGVFSAQEME